MIFLQGILAKIITSVSWKAISAGWKEFKVGLNNWYSHRTTKKDGEKIKDAKDKNELDKAADDRIKHF